MNREPHKRRRRWGDDPLKNKKNSNTTTHWDWGKKGEQEELQGLLPVYLPRWFFYYLFLCLFLPFASLSLFFFLPEKCVVAIPLATTTTTVCVCVQSERRKKKSPAKSQSVESCELFKLAFWRNHTHTFREELEIRKPFTTSFCCCVYLWFTIEVASKKVVRFLVLLVNQFSTNWKAKRLKRFDCCRLERRRHTLLLFSLSLSVSIFRFVSFTTQLLSKFLLFYTRRWTPDVVSWRRRFGAGTKRPTTKLWLCVQATRVIDKTEKHWWKREREVKLETSPVHFWDCHLARMSKWRSAMWECRPAPKPCPS